MNYPQRQGMGYSQQGQGMGYSQQGQGMGYSQQGQGMGYSQQGQGMGYTQQRPPQQGMGYSQQRPPQQGMGYPQQRPPQQGMGYSQQRPPQQGMGYPKQRPPQQGMGYSTAQQGQGMNFQQHSSNINNFLSSGAVIPDSSGVKYVYHQTRAGTNYHQEKNFQPPQHRSRRSAVIIGINYQKSQSELKGCHNDAKNMFYLLLDAGWKREEIRFGIDDIPYEVWRDEGYENEYYESQQLFDEDLYSQYYGSEYDFDDDDIYYEDYFDDDFDSGYGGNEYGGGYGGSEYGGGYGGNEYGGNEYGGGYGGNEYGGGGYGGNEYGGGYGGNEYGGGIGGNEYGGGYGGNEYGGGYGGNEYDGGNEYGGGYGGNEYGGGYGGNQYGGSRGGEHKKQLKEAQKAKKIKKKKERQEGQKWSGKVTHKLERRLVDQLPPSPYANYPFPEPDFYPTKDIILDELEDLIYAARPGDQLVFFFAGHGGQVDDVDGDEKDGKDETICTVDNKQIVDDELHELLVLNLPWGANMFVMFDACNSSTGMDLPFMCQDEIPMTQEFQQLLTKDGRSHAAEKGISGRLGGDGLVVFFGGATDGTEAGDLSIAEQSSGVMCYALQQIMREKNFQVTYSEVLRRMRLVAQAANKGWPQIPHLSYNRPKFDPKKSYLTF